jgi:hypothetical protein
MGRDEMNPVDIVLEMAVQKLEILKIDEKVFEMPEVIQETDLTGLNDYALVTMMKEYFRDYEKNPIMLRLFGIPFRIAVFLYRTSPGFRRRMNWIFLTLGVYFLNYRYYSEKSCMPCRWDMTDEQIIKDIEEKGY